MKAADAAKSLNFHTDVSALVTVRKNAGMEAGLDIFRFRGGFQTQPWPRLYQSYRAEPPRLTGFDLI